MSEWKTYKLGDIGRIITGKTPPTIKKEYFDGDYPFITPVDMNGQKSIYSASRSLSETGKHLLRNNLLESNTICVSCIGSDLGKVVKTTKKSFTNQQINSIICNENFDPDFIYYALTFISPELRSIGHHSTAVPIINKTDFSLFKIHTPKDKNIQTKIASILSSLDDKIELNRQTNQTLETIAQTLFQEMCVPKGEELPEGWKVGKLGEVMEIKYGKDHKHLEDGLIPVYGSGGIMRYANKALYDDESILIPRKGTLSNLFYINKPFWSVDTMFYSKIKNKTHGKFLFLLLKTMNLASMNVGSAVPSLTTELLNKLEIVLPPNEIIKKFNELVTPIFATLEFNEQENQTLITLRDSLLPKLMKGEIEI